MASWLLVDYDIRHKYFEKYIDKQEFLNSKKSILENLGYHVLNMKLKESKHGYHLYITIKENIPIQRIFALQYYLGDDHNRANYNFFRLETWGEKIAKNFNILFDKKIKIECKEIKKSTRAKHH